MMTSVIERFKRMTESIHALRNQQGELDKNHVTGKIMAIASRWAWLYRINSFSSLKYLGKATMTVEIENLMLEILKKIQADISSLKFDMVDLKHRVSMIERNTADIATSYAGQSLRIDRLEERLDRIERRLELSVH